MGRHTPNKNYKGDPPLHLTFDKSKVARKDTPVFWMPNDSSC